MRSVAYLLIVVAGAATLLTQNTAYGQSGAVKAAEPTKQAPQFICKAEINYQWKIKAHESGKAAETAPDIELSALYGIEEARGDDEAGAKAKLLDKIVLSKSSAREKCRVEHENLSGCIASKFNANTSLFERLEFAARKKLQEAIEADCKSTQGTCGEAKNSEPTCIAPKIEEVAAPAAEGVKEEPKKGGKKK